jgi:hypothetical protein
MREEELNPYGVNQLIEHDWESIDPIHKHSIRVFVYERRDIPEGES